MQTLRPVLNGILATHVDDTLGAGIPSFVTDAELIQLTFDRKSRSLHTVLFAGINIQHTADVFRMHQAPYARHLSLLSPNSSFNYFRAGPHQLAWLTHTRSDLLSSVAIVAHIFTTYTPTQNKRLNKAIQAAQANRHSGIIQHRLAQRTLCLVL